MIGADSMQVEPHPPGWRTAQLCSMPGAVPQEAVNEPVADQHSGILVCHLRDGDRVFETHWTIGRGNEVMAAGATLSLSRQGAAQGVVGRGDGIG